MHMRNNLFGDPHRHPDSMTEDLQFESLVIDAFVTNVHVLILYDRGGAFAESARLMQEMYKSLGAEVVCFPTILPQLKEKINHLCKNKRVVLHYIGHGRNSGNSNYPSICVCDDDW